VNQAADRLRIAVMHLHAPSDAVAEAVIRTSLRVMKQKGRAFRGAAFLESWPMLGMCAAGAREFRIAAELGFKTAVTTRPGVLFKAHRDYLTALPRISVKGQFQQQRYVNVLMSGAGSALWNGFRRVNAA